jgi:hypothetical protein
MTKLLNTAEECRILSLHLSDTDQHIIMMTITMTMTTPVTSH